MTPTERTAHETLLRESYARVVGGELCPGDDLFNAPFIVCSHDTKPDPVFTYGNQAALDLFELDWHAFTNLPSRLSAEPVHQSERRRLLDAVADKGFISDYAGVRVSRTGKRFQVTGAIVWNLIDEKGHLRGQAATFAPPEPIETTVVAPEKQLPRTIACRYCNTEMEPRILTDTQAPRGFIKKSVKMLGGIYELWANGKRTWEPSVSVKIFRCPRCFSTELFTPPIESGYEKE